ncbi:outer membrane protein assembly factor BamD [Noviherbaspirillum galbum]|uniref:Outer membrane protein assembly factor BamD n=1 Tax=Noviherbaspirillum galbum TaxID=2709383 RepID=A0A6B3SG38_9BURK|nr:outer membrane protein assembly factor BamD [Noviherbaspirillum galbum]NEX59811.1 outer membrane protein assembly factor BamD [Noviherbaspirillum galbum]
MQKRSLKFLAPALAMAIVLSGCGLLPDKADETRDWSASKLYSEARDELSTGSYDKAIQYFEKLEARYPFGTYAQQAQMEIAYAYYRQSDSPQALAAIERFIKLHPNHPNVDYMYYLRGLVNFNDRLGFFDFIVRQDPSERDPKAAREAFDSFRLLAERFPDSIYAKDAIARMKYLVNALAQYEVHVASYYYRRGAYLAAANRAQTALVEYREAPAVEEALSVMVRSYDALGMTDLREDAKRVLDKNFPNSVYLRGGPDRSGPWWKIW